MSGGAFDYVEYKIRDVAVQVRRRAINHSHAFLLRCFAKLLDDVSDACHEIDYDFSGDKTLSQEWVEKIKAMVTPEGYLDLAINEAETQVAILNSAIEWAKKKRSSATPG